MTKTFESTPQQQLAAIRSRLEHPRAVVLPHWKPAPLVPPHHLVMLDDLDLQGSLFLYFDRIDPYLQLRFAVSLVRMAVRHVRRQAEESEAADALASLADLVTDGSERLAALVDSPKVRELVRSAVQITSSCAAHTYTVQVDEDSTAAQVAERDLKPENWQRRLLRSPYLTVQFHPGEPLTGSFCMPPEAVLDAHMQQALVCETELAPLREELVQRLPTHIRQLLWSYSHYPPSHRSESLTPQGAFNRSFAHTMHALGELIAAIPLAGGYRHQWGLTADSEDTIEPSVSLYYVGSTVHAVLDEVALALDPTATRDAIVHLKAALFADWMRRTPVFVEPEKGQTTAGREVPVRKKPSVADVVPLDIEVKTLELAGGRVGERLTAYATDDDGRRRKAGWLSLEQSTHLPGAWQVADMHVLPDWQMRGVATAMLLYALDIHGTLHPDWVGRIPQWGLRAWRRLLTAVTPSGARVRVCYPRVKTAKAPVVPEQSDVLYVQAKRGSWPEGCRPETEPRAMVRTDVPVELREFALAIVKREDVETVDGPIQPAIPLWPLQSTDQTGDAEAYRELRRYLEQPPATSYDPLRDRPAPRNEPEIDDQPERQQTGRADFLYKWLATTGTINENVIVSEIARRYASWLREHHPRIARVFRQPLSEAIPESSSIDAQRLEEDALRPLDDPRASEYLQAVLDHAVDVVERYADGLLPAEELNVQEIVDSLDVLLVVSDVARDDAMPWTRPIRMAARGLYQAAVVREAISVESKTHVTVADMVAGFDSWLLDGLGYDFIDIAQAHHDFVRSVRRRTSVFSAGEGFE